MHLLSLPATLVEEIIALALELPISCDFDCRTTIFSGTEAPQQSIQSQATMQTARSLFLTSHHLHEIASSIVYKRTTFQFHNIHDLSPFLTRIGNTNSEMIRYVALQFDEEIVVHSAMSDEATPALSEYAAHLSRLPTELRGLYVQLPLRKDEKFGRPVGTHPLVRDALQRFGHLETLALVNPEGAAPWDILYTFQANSTGSRALPFPFLKAVYLHGSWLPEKIGDVRLSHQEMPRGLNSVELIGLDDGSKSHEKDGGEASQTAPLLADLLQNLFRRPLRQFVWSRGEYFRIYRRPTPQCLSDAHLHLLLHNHGHTLQRLSLDLVGHMNRRWAITEAAVARLLVSMRALRHATIKAPFLDMLRLLQAVGGDNGAYTKGSQHQRGLSPSLRTLCLTLSATKDKIHDAVHSDRLAVLCTGTRIWRPAAVHLQLVIGEWRARNPSTGDYRGILGRSQAYLELEQRIVNCISGCAMNAEGDYASRTAGVDCWLRVALIDLFRYDTFWHDSPDRWHDSE